LNERKLQHRNNTSKPAADLGLLRPRAQARGARHNKTTLMLRKEAFNSHQPKIGEHSVRTLAVKQVILPESSLSVAGFYALSPPIRSNIGSYLAPEVLEVVARQIAS
jgi:hypothetical protein